MRTNDYLYIEEKYILNKKIKSLSSLFSFSIVSTIYYPELREAILGEYLYNKNKEVMDNGK